MIKVHIFFIVSFTVALLVGVIFGLFHYKYLLWQGKPLQPYNIHSIDPIYQKAFVYYFKDTLWLKETIPVEAEELQEACFIVTQKWLTTLQEEHTIPNYVSLESTLVDSAHTTVYVSCNKSLFFTHFLTHQKLLILVSLAKTLASLQSSLQRYVILVHHEPLVDYHIDCQLPFNINYWSTLY